MVIAAVALTGCQKELSFETSGVPGGTGTGGSSSADCKACVYFPVCDGSVYTYYDTLSTNASVITDTFHFIKDTIIDNKTFVKNFSPLTQAYTYFNCTDGATRIIAYNASTLGGNTLSVADLTMLKANLPAGGVWQDKLTNPFGQQVTYLDSIAAKGVSRTVNGKTFPDVIQVNQQSGVDVPLLGFIVVTEGDYYFARGVGQIEVVITDPATGTVIQHRAIKSYYIP